MPPLLRGAALPATAGGDALLLEVGGPDDLTAETRAAVEPRHRRAFGGGGDLEIGEARAGDGASAAGGGKQRLVDEGAGERADLCAERGARERGAEQRDAAGQQRTTGSRADGGESERGHQSLSD